MNLREFGFTNATPAIPPSCVLAEPLEHHMENVGQYSAAVLALTFDSGSPEHPTATSYVFYFFRNQVDPNRQPDDILTFKIKADDPSKIFIVDKYLGGVDFGAENALPLAKRGTFSPGTLSKGDEAKIAALAERLIQNRKVEQKKSTSRFCGQCGVRNAASENFCTACGSALVTAQSVVVTAPPIQIDQQSRAHEDNVPPVSTTPAASPRVVDEISTTPNGLLSSAVVYVIAYLIAALPTYVLPYFGSNSSVLNVFGAATGLGALPQFWFHLVALYLLIVVTWIRGGFMGKQWLTIFPVLAAIFDMVPGFSVIPLLPTVFHVLALVLGVSGNRVVVEAAADRKRRLIISAVGLAAVVTLAFVKTQTFFLNAKQGPSWERPNSQSPPSPTQLPQPLSNSIPSAPPPENAGSASPSIPDPALSLSTVKVDPAAVTITSGGFAGLKVGHTPQDARLFFGRDIVTMPGCGPNPKWTTHSPQGLSKLTLASNAGRLVAFQLMSDEYQTRSGLKVGLPESRLLDLIGNDPTLESKKSTGDNAVENQIVYTLGRQSPTSMRIVVQDGRITVLIFGSSREVDNFLLTC